MAYVFLVQVMLLKFLVTFALNSTRLFSRKLLWLHFPRVLVSQSGGGRQSLVSLVLIFYLKFWALAGEGTRFIDKVLLLLPPDFCLQGWFMYTRCSFDSPPRPPRLAGCCREPMPQGATSVHAHRIFYWPGPQCYSGRNGQFKCRLSEMSCFLSTDVRFLFFILPHYCLVVRHGFYLVVTMFFIITHLVYLHQCHASRQALSARATHG